MKTTTKGFTLIELLVVIGIISLLSSILLASLTDARIRAQNTAVVAQIREYQKAFALFYADNGRYPMPNPPSAVICLGPVGTTCTIAAQGNSSTMTNTVSNMGSEFASLGINTNLAKETNSILFKSAEAATLSTYIPLTAVTTPDIVYYNTQWEGASYRCYDSTCQEAFVYWPIKNTTSDSQSNGTIYYQRADGGDAATSY